MKQRVICFILAIILTITPLTIYLLEFPDAEKHIVINGDFRDWDNKIKHQDSIKDSAQHPNVNIIETSLVKDGNKVLLMLAVDGVILEGSSDGSVDQVFVLIDSDSKSTTGYQYNELGADYMLHVYGYTYVGKTFTS